MSENKDALIRRLQEGYLTNPVLLARIAVKDAAWEVRQAAVWEITDPAVLERIATTDKEPYVRIAAVGTLGRIPCQIK